ncbi:unnamed protein product [Didymodactylos carnosus]|uniref:Uncharacterized protein n=1 Tax=Didymodactylos carnosus TaxID=1234261 RepID=A0A8S2QAE6_9BILA|nr:unnamed protein product [Didymodactylos carnosus]CAF4089306.1 unnamed protein product [Didymodactylos carnosus]
MCEDAWGCPENLSIYRWILNAYPQNEWIHELALIKFERFTNEPYKKIPDWRSILHQIENKKIIELIVIKIEQINEKFDIEKLLVQIKDCHLEDNGFANISINLELNQWSIKLKQFQTVHYAICQSNINNKLFFNQHFPSIIHYLYKLKNKSELLVNLLLQILQEKKLKLKQILNFIYHFYYGL